jgi:hypothetical protein
MEPEWLRWQRTEAAEFAREGTRARADVVVDGSGHRQDLPPTCGPER